MYFSLVSPLDQNLDPKCMPYLCLKNHHHLMFVIELESAQKSLEFHQTGNVNVLCYDTVVAEFLTKITNIKNGTERAWEHNQMKEKHHQRRTSDANMVRRKRFSSNKSLPSFVSSDKMNGKIDIGFSLWQLQWATMRDQWRGCARKRVTDPETHP